MQVEDEHWSAELSAAPEAPVDLCGRHRLVVQGIDIQSNTGHSRVCRLLRDRHYLAVEIGRVLVGALYRAAAHDIVELIEQDILPCLLQLLGRIIVLTGQLVGEDRECLRLIERVLGGAVRALHVTERAVAAAGVVLELVLHDLHVVVLRVLEILVGGRVKDALRLVVRVDLVYQHDGRSAAVIADAVERHQRFLSG